MGVIKASLCEVNLWRSRQHLLLALLSHGGALLALWLAAFGWGVKALLMVVVVVHFRYYHRRFIGCRHAAAIAAIRLMGDQWRVKLGEGWFRAWPQGEIVVTSMLICFRLQVEGKRRPAHLILFADSADPDELHGFRLRLMLESAALFGAAEPVKEPK